MRPHGFQWDLISPYRSLEFLLVFMCPYGMGPYASFWVLIRPHGSLGVS